MHNNVLLKVAGLFLALLIGSRLGMAAENSTAQAANQSQQKQTESISASSKQNSTKAQPSSAQSNREKSNFQSIKPSEQISLDDPVDFPSDI